MHCRSQTPAKNGLNLEPIQTGNRSPRQAENLLFVDPFSNNGVHVVLSVDALSLQHFSGCGRVKTMIAVFPQETVGEDPPANASLYSPSSSSWRMDHSSPSIFMWPSGLALDFELIVHCPANDELAEETITSNSDQHSGRHVNTGKICGCNERRRGSSRGFEMK